MSLTPGVCLACGQDAWRRATHAKTGQVVALWPDPLSTYASAETPTGYAPGLPYCRACRPILGAALPRPIVVMVGGAPRPAQPEPEPGDDGPITLGAIVDVVPAPVRYGAWFEPRFREWLQAWLKDHLELSDTDAAPLLAQWDSDARAVKGLFDGRPVDRSA